MLFLRCSFSKTVQPWIPFSWMRTSDKHGLQFDVERKFYFTVTTIRSIMICEMCNLTMVSLKKDKHCYIFAVWFNVSKDTIKIATNIFANLAHIWTDILIQHKSWYSAMPTAAFVILYLLCLILTCICICICACICIFCFHALLLYLLQQLLRRV